MQNFKVIILFTVILLGFSCKTKKNTVVKDYKITDNGVNFYYSFTGDIPYKFTMMMDKDVKTTNVYWFSAKNNNYNGIMRIANQAFVSSSRQVMAPKNNINIQSDRLFRILSARTYKSLVAEKKAFIKITDRYDAYFQLIGEEEIEINTFGKLVKYKVRTAECKAIKLSFKFIDDANFPLIVSIKSNIEMKLDRIAAPELNEMDFNLLIGESLDAKKVKPLRDYIADRSFRFQKTPSIVVVKSSLGGVHINTKNNIITDIFLLKDGSKYNCYNRKFSHKTSNGLYIGMTKIALETKLGKGTVMVDGGSMYYNKAKVEIVFENRILPDGKKDFIVSEIHYLKI